MAQTLSSEALKDINRADREGIWGEQEATLDRVVYVRTGYWK